jgi:hypothetical protein
MPREHIKNEITVKDCDYRRINLAANGISPSHPGELLPGHILDLISVARRERKDRPQPTKPVKVDWELLHLSLGASEDDLDRYFNARIFPNPEFGSALSRADRERMNRHSVPNAGVPGVCTPKPNIIYGFRPEKALSEQMKQLLALGPEAFVNSKDLVYPFFSVAYAPDGSGTSGGQWAATNECLGTSATCVGVLERLNQHLENHGGECIETTVFSITTSSTEARIHVSWKDKERFHFQQISSFLLQDQAHYQRFREAVQNIIDWGLGVRLKRIQTALDNLANQARVQGDVRAPAIQTNKDGEVARVGNAGKPKHVPCHASKPCTKPKFLRRNHSPTAERPLKKTRTTPVGADR